MDRSQIDENYMKSSSIHIHQVDYHNTDDTAALMILLNAYAKDAMGGGQALSTYTQQHLIERLQQVDGALSLLAYDKGVPVGLLNAFKGFSTFAAKPLFNIHDIVVISSHRKQGIAQQLLASCEKIAQSQGCCKLTLEVLSGNRVAKNSYQQFGFHQYVLDESVGKAEFWEKKIEA